MMQANLLPYIYMIQVLNQLFVLQPNLLRACGQ
jgi:hypothetical protein